MVADEIWHGSLVGAIFRHEDDHDFLIDKAVHALDVYRPDSLCVCVETPETAPPSLVLLSQQTSVWMTLEAAVLL